MATAVPAQRPSLHAHSRYWVVPAVRAVLALAAASLAVTNDSGLMHVSAALGTPTVAIFGPTSPWHWKPLNPVAAILEPEGEPQARERARTLGNPAVAHHRTAGVSVERVLEAVRKVLAERPR